MKENNKLFLSLGVHSAAIIAFQLILMQLLSVVQWHHFAFMVISIAMLGFGASGTFIALYRKKLINNFSWLYPFFMILTGLSMIIVFPLSRINVIEFDVFRLFSDYSQLWVLAVNYLVFFIPFFFGATAIGMVFIKIPEKIGKCYFANLVGSGIGGIFVLFLTGWLFPEKLIIIAGILPVLAGLISYYRKKTGLQFGGALVSLIIAAYFLVYPFSLNPSEYKGISKALNLPEAEVEHREPDTHGIIEVVSSPALRYAPALSMSYTDEVPVKKNVFLNGNFYGVIPHNVSDEKHIHQHTTMELPYVMNERNNVMIINSGTGAHISHALTNSASVIDAVIDNNGVLNLMKSTYLEESGGLFKHENVNIHFADSRIFLSGLKEKKYDLIKLPIIDAFGGTAGLNSLQENYDLTIEAFDLMWNALSENGVIAVTSWMDYPSRASLKIASTLAETARNNGIEQPEDHIVAIRGWGTITFVLKKNRVTFTETEKVRDFCNIKYFDPAFLAGMENIKRNHFNKLDDSSFFDYLDNLILEENSDLSKDYGFAIDPSTDDRPYFYQFLRLKNLSHIISIYGIQQLPYIDLGYLTVIITLIQSAVLAIILIVLPLFRLKNTGKKKSNVFLFFASIGVGYMFIEIIMIQKFVLYFGYPIYAITAVISTMLIASGIGSLYSARIKNPGGNVALIALIVLLVLIVYAFSMTNILQNTLSFSRPLKIIISLILIGIPAFFMGMPFPMAVRHLSNNSPALIPWAWGINGCFSVISSALAMFLALEIGFTAVMIGAVICYFIAFAAYSGDIINKIKIAFQL